MDKDCKHHWENVLIPAETTIISAIKRIDIEGLRVLLVVDEDKRLIGVITDGDIRRHLLKQASLEESVVNIMNKNPVTARLSEEQDQLLLKMHKLGILHLPILDDDGHVVGIETFNSLYIKKKRDNIVIFMAGGMGKRLHPLTIDCPKPLIKIGEKPIAEILLENFIKNRFENYYFSVNYKAEMIREHFGSGDRWGIKIQYIEENSALGTAGSLSLLPSIPNKPFLVVNADILTNINLDYLLEFHQENRNQHKVYATMCVRKYQNTIPFGLVHINETDYRLINIEEKPTKNFFVNAGIYILEPDALQYLAFNSYCDMPHFLTSLVQRGLNIATFPIREYWIDVGHHDNLAKT